MMEFKLSRTYVTDSQRPADAPSGHRDGVGAGGAGGGCSDVTPAAGHTGDTLTTDPCVTCHVQVPLLSPQECEAQPGSSLPHGDQVSVSVVTL